MTDIRGEKKTLQQQMKTHKYESDITKDLEGAEICEVHFAAVIFLTIFCHYAYIDILYATLCGCIGSREAFRFCSKSSNGPSS